MSLEFHNVTHNYGKTRVLQDISFKAAEGEILCLLGPSGGGKSTLLRLAAGLEPLQNGQLTLDGELLAKPGTEPPPEQRPIGLVFQDHVLFPHLTVATNLSFGLDKLGRPEKQQRVQELLEQMGLVGLGERYPHELSGGQQQRVALARAMAPKPRVLLLDEPFASVDSTLRRQLRSTTRAALKTAGTTAIVVTHDPEEAMQLADSIAVMANGIIAQHGSPADIWQQPATLQVALLFGDATPIAAHTRNGIAHSAYGDLATTLPDGPATIAARPQGIRVALPDKAHPATATISDLRLLGHRWQLQLQALNAAPFDTTQPTVNVATSTSEGFSPGAQVHTTLMKKDCFIFQNIK